MYVGHRITLGSTFVQVYAYLYERRGIISEAGQPCRNICQIALGGEIVDIFRDNVDVRSDAEEVTAGTGQAA